MKQMNKNKDTLANVDLLLLMDHRFYLQKMKMYFLIFYNSMIDFLLILDLLNKSHLMMLLRLLFLLIYCLFDSHLDFLHLYLFLCIFLPFLLILIIYSRFECCLFLLIMDFPFLGKKYI